MLNDINAAPEWQLTPVSSNNSSNNNNSNKGNSDVCVACGTWCEHCQGVGGIERGACSVCAVATLLISYI